MAIELVFETHCPTVDNEQGRATGWLYGELSERVWSRRVTWACGVAVVSSDEARQDRRPLSGVKLGWVI